MKKPQYKRLLFENRNLLGFGCLMTFYSSIGQTFMVGVFGPSIQAEFNLSHTTWGTMYMIGTLASGAVLTWSGSLIDRFRLPVYALCVCGLIVIACGLTALVSGPVGLVLCIFLLRHSGQGLASHTAMISMTRYFVRNRGRAIAIASLGEAAGQAILPFLALVSISAIGWRWTYGWFGIIIAITSIPTVLRLLRGWAQLHREHLERFDAEDSEDNSASSWNRQQVLRDPRFYLMLPGLVAPGFIGTALFFNHLNIADAKGWEASWITGNYVIYAVAIVFSMLASGALVDRFSASSVVQYMLIPLVAALIIIGFADHHLWFIPYMIMIGINFSMVANSTSAIWPELYGVGHLGAIKSMHSALAVVSSAFGPMIFGILIDHELSIRNICLLAATYALLCNVVLVLTLRTGKKRND